ncbi:MAG: TIGR04255 family protein [Planctomycetes bacterium]|nr:TIGR04255 family protein [Planctomycetota bacterium]
MSETQLPDFENPPVVETVLGVQFEPLEKWTVAHMGAFWRQLGEDWPTVREQTALPDQFETFDEMEQMFVQLRVNINKPNDGRCQFIHKANQWMVQLQNGRLHSNWLGMDGKQYPRFEACLTQFEARWQAFVDFCSGMGLGAPKANQWEVTYLNLIPRGSVWNEPKDWANLLNQSLPGVRSDLPNMKLENLGGEWHFRIGEKEGRLHVRVRHVHPRRQRDPDSLELNLTARGPMAGNGSLDDIRLGLLEGRKAIVTGFRSMSSDEALSYWRMKR